MRKIVKEYLDKNLEDMADSHIEAFKDRYYRYSKEQLEQDLCGHDFSCEVETIEEELKIKLTAKEYDYCESKFNQKIVEIF